MPNRPEGPRTPDQACLQELVAAQAARTPDATALVAGEERISYGALARRAGRLARRLAALGVGPEVRVGVFLTRTPSLVATLLGILEAGGTYVPLDPDYPQERLRFMLEDAGATVLVTEQALLPRLPPSEARILVLDAAPGEGGEEDEAPEAELRRALPGNLAYLIYTSGSTGRPKAVAIEHRSAVAFVRWALATFDAGELEAVLASTSISFDLSIFELFVPLSRGGRVILAVNALELPRLPAASEITLVNTVPSVIAELVRSVALPPAVRSVNLAGEPLKGALAQSVYASGIERVRNLYGPSEDTTYSTYELVEKGSRSEPTIGKPLTGTWVRLLDGDMSPVRPGEPGEICLGGEGLARGYLGRPDLTAARFVPDPGAEASGERLYRTGDLGRLLADGRIEYLGRIDQQVKVRGFRIELGEIEAALLAHPGLGEAAVVAHEERPGEKRLVAYLVARDAERPADAELRALLGSRLPDYMVPAFFVGVPALPLTPNRKIDRQELARRPLPAAGGAGAVLAPRNPTEELLAGVWEEVLRRERVGVDEGFLDLGGDSLLAAQVQARVRGALGIDLPASEVLEASTVSALAERVKRALAERPQPQLAIPQRPRDAKGEPLSSAQRRLWFLERLVPGTPANSIPVVMRLTGPLVTAVLERCLVELAARHQALRTTIGLGADGEPLQIVAPPARFPLPVVDLSSLPAGERQPERRRLAMAEARRPLDTQPGVLWRCTLCRVADWEHDLFLTLHHVISDGESVRVLERELAALYSAYLRDRPSPLPPPAVQPADVAAWERDGRSAEAQAPHLAYFRRHLAGAPGGLDLPADRPRPPERSWRGVSHNLTLPPALARSVRDFARRRGATRYMVLLASWVALLRRITGEDDFVVGTVFAQRGRPELEGVVGYFANALPLRVESPGDPAFGELLSTVRSQALGVFAHQELPLEPLTEMLRPGRANSSDPLFQVFFAFRGNTGPREMAPGLTMEWREEDHGAAQFDLFLDLEEKEEEIGGRLVASADLFTPQAAGRWARGWLALLADALERPEAPASTLALAGPAERHALLVEWSRLANPPAWSGSVPARIAAWAAARPEAVAVEPAEPDRPALTYGELVARARRLAVHLRARGVGLDVRVGVYADRSPDTVVGMLAVLLAGGAFLPLDPAYPPDRLTLTLEDSRVPVLLASRALAASLPTGDAEVVLLDAPPEDAADGGAWRDLEPEDLAYIIYTSGSTGRPKGVLIQHQGFYWAVEALAVRSGVEPGGRVLQFASAGFDASVWEIWSTLLHGATLVFARHEDLLPGPALLATLSRRGITNVFLTPSALAALPEGASRELASLGGLVVGGEAFPPELVTRWAAGRRLWNAYGPTESSICVSMSRLGEDGETPIGRPVADSRLLVLGRHLEVLPRGVPGELYLGGRGLARGYLGRPELTARAFVPDPVSGEPGARLYRTGDLVRFRPDGQLEFLGRADRQVKVRGFRIEPGEIEAQIAEHPGIREAVVVPYEAGPRDLRLAAYAAVPGPEAPTAAELRAFLRARLPEHMVPSSITFLPALPLTPGGKVDRRALPPPSAEGGAAPAGGTAAPSTPTEDLLAGIWSEVLGRTDIGAADDFFDLGGHSLLIGQVLARVRAAFGVEVPVRAVFETRTLAALARQVDAMLQAGVAGAAPPPLARSPRNRPLPLSFAQQRLWFLDRLEPGSPVYNLALAFRLTGPLDATILEQSLDEVFRRHEVLRTTFTEGEDGEPHPVVAPFAPAALPRSDLASLGPEGAAAEAHRRLALEAERPFDLQRGPVARALLLRLGEQEHLLLFACHHIAFDGWSVGVLRRELGALYSAYAAGRPSPLPELAVQYADYAVWQRRWLTGAALETQLDYWRERLRGAPAALELPADRPRPPAQSYRGATLALAFPEGVAAGLRGLARNQGSTLFMTALAAYAALLSRFTGQTDLVVGSPFANRREAGIEGLIGFFVNTLALRIALGGDPAFRTLLAHVRESALSAHAHQDLPFERLVEELQPVRDLSRSPLFQVMFALDPLRDNDLAPGLGCELLRIDGGAAKFDLTLFLNESQGGLTALLEYATDLFDATTIGRLGRSFVTLAAGLVEHGARLRLSELPLLGAGERWQILGEWNEPATWQAGGECLHQLVAAQRERTPEATALVTRAERLTYRELGRRSGELARRLAALGVGPEVRVGVCLSRTSTLVEALLGILEAGGTYVPLDPNYPQERLGFMLEDADAAVILTEESLAPRLPESKARVVLLDRPAEGEPQAAPVPAIAGNLAYLIYTSGSTGRPKAVAIEHRSAVAFVRWSHGIFSPSEMSGVLASTSISFDLSVFELFSTLARGGKVILAEDALELSELPAAGEVTLVNTVPSAIAALLELLGTLLPGVRSVNLAGEPLKGALAQAVYAAGADRVRNLYGPSEDTTYSTFEQVERGSRREPTIGRPLAGTWARLLDRELSLVPVGVPGEICLGGEGLARGYLGRPELTAERFMPDPVGGSTGGARLYRTGDLGRYLPDGRIEYLGRLDNQVKVRGFRIELGEVEKALEAHPLVREAVVIARGEVGGARELAAYVVAAGPPAPTAAELADHLRVGLAEFMIPATFTLLEKLPLTPNGKVDKRALPAPAASAPSQAEAATGPSPLDDPLVELLAGIWAEVLERSDLPGPQESFFELGGHSLLATRVVSRVRAALGVELPLRALFAAPTVAALAAAVAALRAESAGTEAAPPPSAIERLADSSEPPLSFAQQRLWLLDRLEPGAPVYNLPSPRAIQGPLDPALLERALGEVVRRHEVLRTTFVVDPASGEPRLVVAPPSGFRLPVVDLSGLPPEARTAEAARIADEDARTPFDLAAGPLYRARLLALAGGNGEWRLLWTMHHICGDGWSLDRLSAELSALYQAYREGRPSPLPELAIQYADFAAWQRQWLEGPVLAGQLAYWRERLRGAPEALDLPTDRQRPPVETSRGAHFLAPLPEALTAALRAYARRRGATLFMVLLSGFASLLRRLTGADDVLVGTPIAGRGRREIEDLIGFFVNTLVLRVDLAGAPSLDALVARVRETALAAYAHQDLPFERLVEELAPQRSLARSPLFQVSFVLGVEESVRELEPGLPLAPLAVETGTAKFDLTLGLDLQGGTLVADLEYRTDLFDRTTVLRWAGLYTRLLAAAVATPGLPLDRLDPASAAERQLLLREWNDTAGSAERDECLHQLFEEQAARTPEAVALVSPDGRQRLTYRELDDRAEELARRLRALGLGPEGLAGVLLDRSVELIVSFLAVLKAGGAYVPIDPAYPRQRVAQLLSSSDATLLLTRRAIHADLGGSLPPTARPLFVDESALRLTPAGREAGAPPPLPGNLAYLIYTSGSTGVPKGVAIEHRSAVAFVRWARDAYSPAELAGSLASTSVSFDVSVMEIYVPLCSGGTVLLAENALALPTLPARAEVTMICTVPSAMAELVRNSRLPDSVRTVNLAGEAVEGALVRRVYLQSRAERVIDAYGPSEDTTYSTTSVIPRGAETPAIGRPIRGTQARLLDAELLPVPIGVAGAVYLAGTGLARGYLNRPDLTAERFLPDPYGQPGARLYAVGDLGRYRTDGEIEYLGRSDAQVKLRGFRIELGEVEAVLASHPAVERAVVAVHAFAPEDRRLAGWVALRPGASVEPAALVDWVGERLPDFMVPAAVAVLEAFPLTPNGKVDRRALPAPAVTGTQVQAEAPRSPLEELVAGLWAEALGQAGFGLHDSFFALGGYSLLAIRLLARLRDATGVDLPLRALFTHSTVAALAAEVERCLRAPGAVPLPPVAGGEPSGETPVSSAQERLWYFHQLDRFGSVLNVPSPLRLAGPLRPAPLARSLGEITRRHGALRTTFFNGREGLVQRITPPAPAVGFALPQVDLTALPPQALAEEGRRLTEEEAREPFDLAAGPLWRTRLLRLGAEEHRLLLTFHHIVVDGWSIDILERELLLLYPALAETGEPPALEPALQYADFVAWQRRQLQPEALAPQLDYWRRQLASVPPVLELPADRPRPQRQSFRGRALYRPLAPELAQAVKELGRREGATLFMTSFAAFGALLARATGRTDLVLGSPVANRHTPGTEGIFGFFVGLLPFRLDLSGDPTFRELLRRARESALGAYAHQDLPFERLVDELELPRDPSRSPLVQVMLSIQTLGGEPQRFAGLAAEPVEVHTATSQFDFTLGVVDAPQGLTLQAEYPTALFDTGTVERLLDQLTRLLEAATADPEVRLSALPAEIGAHPGAEIAAPAPVEEAVEDPEKKGEELAQRQAQLAARRASLSSADRDLLAARLRRKK